MRERVVNLSSNMLFHNSDSKHSSFAGLGENHSVTLLQCLHLCPRFPAADRNFEFHLKKKKTNDLILEGLCSLISAVPLNEII